MLLCHLDAMLNSDSFQPVVLTKNHCSVASVIHQTGFDFSWSTETFESLLLLPTTLGWIDETGVLICSRVCDEIEILTICVHKNYRHHGYGDKWLDFLFQYADAHQINRILLEVSVENIPALKLYQKKGFIEIARRKNYYKKKDGTFCDAVCMEKQISF